MRLQRSPARHGAPPGRATPRLRTRQTHHTAPHGDLQLALACKSLNRFTYKKEREAQKMQVPVHATQRGKLETPIPSILCKAAEFKPPRFSQAGTAAQAVLGGRGGQNQRLLTGLERWILGGGGRVGRSLCGCIKVKLETSVQREMARCMCTHGSRASIPDPRPEPEGCPPRTPVPHRHIGCSRGAEPHF